jgi:hypothetical protein
VISFLRFEWCTCLQIRYHSLLYCVRPGILLHGNAADPQTAAVTVLLLYLRRLRSDSAEPTAEALASDEGAALAFAVE